MNRSHEFRLGGLALVLVGAVTLTGCLFNDGGDVPMRLPDAREVRMWRGDFDKDEPGPLVVASAITTQTSLPQAASNSLSQIGEAAVPQLLVALSDADPQVRMLSAEALGLMGDDAKEAVPALTKLLDDPQDEVRRAAAEALGRIGPPAAPAIHDLIRALHAPNAVPVETSMPALY